MATHTVIRGDCLSSIAKQYGFSDYKTIYDHPQNQAFKQKRPNPNLIMAGDEIFIPEVDASKSESVSADSAIKIKLTVPKGNLRILIKDDDDQPAKGKSYKLTGPGFEKSASTTGAGMIDAEVPVHIESFDLELQLADPPAQPRKFKLLMGDLDPCTELSGAQQRLANLGFFFGDVDGKEETLKPALEVFQKAFDLEVTGKLDDPSQKKLIELHDGE